MVRENEAMIQVIQKTQYPSRTSKGANRRGTTRYAVRTPLQYRASVDMLNASWKSGFTLDMSAGGMLTDLPEELPVGAILELALDWPGIYHGRPTVRLFAKASVVRIERRGTALRILSHEFHELRPLAVRRRRPESDEAVA